MKTYRLSVCKGPKCRDGGADAVFRAVKEALESGQVRAGCEARRAGCYGLCEQGPNVVIRENTGRPQDLMRREDYQLMGWPEEVHCQGVRVEDVPQLLKRLLHE
jgi:(2Fe-2S) ferredoxin